MEKFFAQNFYSLKNLNKCYLSPYCQILGRDDGFVLERSDLKKQLFMPVVHDKDRVLSLFEKLLNGIEMEELMGSLKYFMDNEEDIKEWIKYGMQGGIIE